MFNRRNRPPATKREKVLDRLKILLEELTLRTGNQEGIQSEIDWLCTEDEYAFLHYHICFTEEQRIVFQQDLSEEAKTVADKAAVVIWRHPRWEEVQRLRNLFLARGIPPNIIITIKYKPRANCFKASERLQFRTSPKYSQLTAKVKKDSEWWPYDLIKACTSTDVRFLRALGIKPPST